MHRSFLFLQGPCTPFFDKLAKRLLKNGHEIHRINFCAGDALFWSNKLASNFSGKRNEFKDFLEQYYKRFHITDQILFGDQRFFHRVAVELGKTYGIRTHVFEEGYFRPSWVTLESGGVNAHSLLPRDPQWYLQTCKKIDKLQAAARFHAPFRTRAIYDVAYHVAGILNPLLYPHYKTHAPTWAPTEYASYIKRFSLLRMIKKREQKRIDTLIASKHPYFVLPLQLNSDAQIRDHSSFVNIKAVIEHVLESFAKYAPSHCHLAMKNHPLDPGFMPYAKIISVYAHRYNLKGRIHFFDYGDLNRLFKHASGVITVNSTSGMVSLEYGIPTIALSDPIYNIPGLTSQSTLDEFWCNPTIPNLEFFAQFKRVVMHATQINGGFYSSQGIELAVENSIQTLTANQSPLEELL